MPTMCQAFSLTAVLNNENTQNIQGLCAHGTCNSVVRCSRQNSDR